MVKTIVVNFPCKICKGAVANNHHAVKCDHFNLWVHIKCNKVSLHTYKVLQKSTVGWYFMKCLRTLFHSALFLWKSSVKQTKVKQFKAVTKKVTSYNQDLIDNCVLSSCHIHAFRLNLHPVVA